MSAPSMFGVKTHSLGRLFVALYLPLHSENWILNDFQVNEVDNQG
jgi:hypothetical protein